MVAPLVSVGAQTLMETPLPPITWLVEGLLATGSTVIFASRPKIGKSWAVLQLGHCIATGKPFLGRSTIKSGVVYLALEDPLKRIQSRLWKLDEQSSDDLMLITRANTLGQGLIDQMTELLKENPSIRLFILDTLQVTRDLRADYSYATDYADLRQYKEFAETYDVCCLLVHHLRKAESRDDDMLDISGTSGISGAVDQMMVLKKQNRIDNEAKLSITGRDVEYTELIIERQNNWWILVDTLTESEIREQTIPEDIKAVVNFIFMQGESWRGTASDLLAQLGFTKLTAPVLGKHLAQHQEYLTRLGIKYSVKRTSNERLISLTLDLGGITGDDSSDSSDSSYENGQMLSLLEV